MIMTDKEILIARLTIFLEENEAYDKFITNLDRYDDIDSLCDYETRCETPEDSISDAFAWSHTPERTDYWSMLSDSFAQEYDSLPTERPEPDPQWYDMWNN